MSQPVRRPGLWLGIGTASVLLLALIGILLFTRTDRGRGEILAYTLATVGGELNGTLVVERLAGNVLTGARLYGIEIRGLEGEVLLAADSAFIEYELPTLVGGDVVINRLVLYDSEIFLRRMPGDTLWNYQAILRDTVESETPGRATLIERLRLVNSQVTVRAPWEPDDDLPARQREREIEAAIADTSRLVVEPVPGGFVRTMLFRVDSAQARDVVIAPDERGGTYLEVVAASGLAYLWSEPPLRVTGLQGRLRVNEGVVRYEVPRFAMPEAALVSAGVIDLRGDEPAYDVVITGEEVPLTQLQWLYPPLPEEGEVSGRLWIETRPEGFFFLARDLLLVMPDTRVAGDLGMVTGDTLRFVEVDLRAAPLDVGTVQRLLPGSTPIEGLRIGSVEITSPSS